MLSTKNIFTLTFSSILILSCGTQKKTSQSTLETPQEIEFQVIKIENNSGYTASKNIEIKTVSELENVWSKSYLNYSRKEPTPSIDFEKNMLLALSMGEQNSGGHSIKIKSISETVSNIIVTIEEMSPGKNCITTESITYPLLLLELHRTNKEILFNRSTKIYDCPEE